MRAAGIWRAVCIKNNVDVSKNNFSPRQRGRGLVGVTDVGVVYTRVCSSASNHTREPTVRHSLTGPIERRNCVDRLIEIGEDSRGCSLVRSRSEKIHVVAYWFYREKELCRSKERTHCNRDRRRFTWLLTGSIERRNCVDRRNGLTVIEIGEDSRGCLLVLSREGTV